MAVTFNVYGSFMVNLMMGSVSSLVDSGTRVRCALMGEGHEFNKDHEYWSHVLGSEITDTDYTPLDLQNKSIVYDKEGNKVYFRSDSLNYGDEVSISARHMVVYVVGNTSETSVLMFSIDFGELRSSVTGRFRINWNEEGVFSISI